MQTPEEPAARPRGPEAAPERRGPRCPPWPRFREELRALLALAGPAVSRARASAGGDLVPGGGRAPCTARTWGAAASAGFGDLWAGTCGPWGARLPSPPGASYTSRRTPRRGALNAPPRLRVRATQRQRSGPKPANPRASAPGRRATPPRGPSPRACDPRSLGLSLFVYFYQSGSLCVLQGK